MDDVGCPRCKTTKYRKFNLKLLVNICGHALCDSCVELLFAKGGGPCPECEIPLKRSGFRVQLFEDPIVEKEIEIRRKLMNVYTKIEADFDTLKNYNDYLEEIECIIFNLVHNVEILETNKRIDDYKKENIEIIKKGRIQQNPDLLELETLLQEEKLLAQHYQLQTNNLEKEEKARKLKTKEELIDDLMFSDTDANSIMESHKTLQQKQQLQEMDLKQELSKKKLEIQAQTTARLHMIKNSSQFSTGISSGDISTKLPKNSNEILYEYEEPYIPNNGPRVPSIQDLLEFNLSNDEFPFGKLIRYSNNRDKACGYHHEYEVRRSLAEAFSDISFYPKTEAGITYYPIT